jgi:hypothetical protein
MLMKLRRLPGQGVIADPDTDRTLPVVVAILIYVRAELIISSWIFATGDTLCRFSGFIHQQRF